MRKLAAPIIVMMALVACTSLPPLEEWERFEVSCRRSDKPNECIVRVKAKGGPPPPIGQCLLGEVALDEGKVVLELKGWGRPRVAGQEERVLEAKVGVRTGVPFKFELLDRGHRDVYMIEVPEKGDPTIDPASGEYSERG